MPNIFAIGDVNTVGYQLTPLAIDAGKNLARRLYTADDCYVSLRLCLICLAMGANTLHQMGSLESFLLLAVKAKTLQLRFSTGRIRI